ncbi:tRNA pseudouridine(55) synthase TruB [Candidatus Uhrbacteria bacterium CG_4_9_14_3_um_filter_50_9]|uniref:tRNA pseudouridine synthase B n=1 Tax=Candidatus Uhrbacteria bacterium CG_4_9_14_3_um_filter_50_9 TaxID=1975035 RepID=A0A2M7XDJ8_9BACT|nr:MAG: tRNA pseudouridine(55) synthase TruB [Candidatus Uhrbacteria bacterium CG_4_9_14_3_um_filter_50_9]
MNTFGSVAKKGILVNNEPSMEGFLLIDKPAGMTSHDVVDRVRRLTGERRVGHAGTLDPFATGLLIVGVGRPATREMQKLSGLDKTYDAVFVLGASSDTDDKTGEITQKPVADVSIESLTKALKTFSGEIKQLPPAYSAIKIKGKKMYEAARAGKPLSAEPRTVTIHAISNISLEADRLVSLSIHCSTGTYIRAIARDLGIVLKGGGYVENLRRTSIGPFSLEDAHALDVLSQDRIQDILIPVEALLQQL